MPRILSKESTLKLMELAKQSYRPPKIVELKEQIEAETRVAELQYTATGSIDEAKIQAIVRMKLDLDNLFVLWAEGTLD